MTDIIEDTDSTTNGDDKTPVYTRHNKMATPHEDDFIEEHRVKQLLHKTHHFFHRAIFAVIEIFSTIVITYSVQPKVDRRESGG